MTSIILVLSFARFPSLEQLPSVTNWDKFAHFMMYFGLTIVVMLEYDKVNSLNERKWRFFLCCLLFPLSMGVLTEVFQTLIVPDRYGDVYDSISNTIGVFAGWLIFVVYKKRFKT